MKQKNTIAIIGNPNCGKTTLFNDLTGAKQTVGNWPGVTVEKKTGTFSIKERTITLVDLPGIYSLQPSSTVSEDERVARDYMASMEPEVIINIVDATNLERNLYLTAQLLELEIPMVVVVNMIDVAKTHGIQIDAEALSQKLSCPVVAMIASRKKGVKELLDAIDDQLTHKKTAPNPIRFAPDIELAISNISKKLMAQGVENSKWVAEQLVEGDRSKSKMLYGVNLETIEPELQEIQSTYNGDVDLAMADARYSFVSKVASEVIKRKGQAGQTLTDKIDKIVLNRWLGLPIFLGVMYLTFIFAINVGSAFIDFFDILFGAIFIDGFGELLLWIGAPEGIKTILADGIGGGIQCVSTFVPVIACMFLALSFLEDSGYMARAAFVMDRLMKALGLPGKSFVPLIIGFGCGVPAIMATRTMEKQSDRITTVLMAPFMSCGARLPVYVLFATAFWPLGGQNLVFALYLIGIAVAIATGFILKRTALRSESSSLVMEIPPYHLPTIRNLLLTTWDRLQGFIVRAGKVIVVLVAILCFLNSLGTDGSFGNEDTDKSVLSQIGKTIVPVFKPMGIQEQNWPAAVGVFTGILAKEAVVGTLDSLYSSIQDPSVIQKEETAEEEAQEEGFNLWPSFKEAVASIGEGFGDIGAFFSDPLGIAVDADLSNVEEQAEAQEIKSATIASMNRLYDGQLGAFAYLLMVLLYMPCGAAMGAIYREVGARWALFAAVWTTAVGYCSATIVYQLGNFASDPSYASLCIGISAAVIAIIIFFLRMCGKEKRSDIVGGQLATAVK